MRVEQYTIARPPPLLRSPAASHAATVAASRVASLRWCSTVNRRFGRAKSPTTVAGDTSASALATSAITRGVAVAVSAIVGATTTSRSSASRRYSGRKSWPHCDTQCASSIATSAIATRDKSRLKLSSTARSGDT